MPRPFACLAVLGIATLGCSAHAGSPFVDNTLEDTKLYFTAPLRWDRGDWSWFGTSVAAIAIAHEFDDDVRNHFAPAGGQPLDGVDEHESRDYLPTAAVLVGTLGFALVLDDADGRHESWRMFEAAGFTAVTTSLLKVGAGRLRPNETPHVDDWRQGGDSFPSMHSSLAFAVGTVFAESGNDRYRWLRRFVGYGMAGATAYARLHDNVHWFSDVVAGAAIGMSTSHFLLDRDRHHLRPQAFSVVPLDRGMMLTYSRSF